MSAKKTPDSPPKTTLTIRTKTNPTEEVEVSVHEYIDLNRQGLIFDGTEADAKAAIAPSEPQAPEDPYNPTPAAGADTKKED